MKLRLNYYYYYYMHLVTLHKSLKRIVGAHPHSAKPGCVYDITAGDTHVRHISRDDDPERDLEDTASRSWGTGSRQVSCVPLDSRSSPGWPSEGASSAHRRRRWLTSVRRGPGPADALAVRSHSVVTRTLPLRHVWRHRCRVTSRLRPSQPLPVHQCTHL